MPSSTFAEMTQPQEGARKIKTGTGRAKIQPVTRTFFRPHRSPILPANRFAIAFTTPKLARNERIAARDAIPNSRSAKRGRMTRSMPTVAPTNAFTATRRMNCSQFARSPRRTGPERTGTVPELRDCTAIRSRFQLREVALGKRALFVQLDDFREIRRRGRDALEDRAHKLLFVVEP